MPAQANGVEGTAHRPSFGRRVEDIDLTAPLSDPAAERLREMVAEAGVLSIPGPVLEPSAFLRVARVLGTPQVQVLGDKRLGDFPEVSRISSRAPDSLGDGKPLIMGRQWHTDDSYMAVPCSLTLLHALEIPERGGDTLFADMTAAYEMLPGPLKGRIAPLRAVHKYLSRRNSSPVQVRTAEEERTTPEVVHPLVRTHPVTGRKAIYLNPNRIDRVEGLPLEEGDALLDSLTSHATHPRFVYRHRWRKGDLIIWDNRVSMHRVEGDFGAARREMLRILLTGSKPC